MKIAQLAPLYEAVPPHKYGGTPRVVHWLTEELVKSGAEVDLYASGDSQTSANLIASCERNLSDDGRLRETEALQTLMIEKLLGSDTKYDIVHSHIGFLPLPQFRHARLPALSTIHHPVNTPERKMLYFEFWEVPMVSVSHSQRVPLPIANWAANIYNGLPEEKYNLVEKPHDYLLFLGRISEGKGLDSAVEIARRSGIHLKVAAKIDPKEKEYFERHAMTLLLQPGVEFLGEIDDPQKQELIGNALALLFPIRWQEPFGLVMIEAMACGTPVIAFNCASVPEVVTHGSNGFICESVESAVDCVKQLKLISRSECRHVFEQRFTARKMAQEYMQVYSDLSKHQARPKASFSVLPESIPTGGKDPFHKETANSPQKITNSEQNKNAFHNLSSFEIRKIEQDKIYTPIRGSFDGRLLVDGWGLPETWGTWTVGERASIELGCDIADGDSLEIKLEVRAFICEQKPQLKVTCRINNSKSVDWEFTKETWQSEKSIIVTAQEWKENRPAELVLDIHEPQSPEELGLSPDKRKIGLGISSIKVGQANL